MHCIFSGQSQQSVLIFRQITLRLFSMKHFTLSFSPCKVSPVFLFLLSKLEWLECKTISQFFVNIVGWFDPFMGDNDQLLIKSNTFWLYQLGSILMKLGIFSTRQTKITTFHWNHIIFYFFSCASKNWKNLRKSMKLGMF